MSAAAWTQLDRRQRRREVIETTIAVAATWVLLLAIYYLVPFTHLTSGQSVTRLVLGIGAFGGVLAWQLHRVKNADFPGLRAVQALGGAIPLFLVAFAPPTSRCPTPTSPISANRSITRLPCT